LFFIASDNYFILAVLLQTLETFCHVVKPIVAMAAAPAHTTIFPASVRPLLLSASPAAENRRRGGGRRLPASKMLQPSGDIDLQVSLIITDQLASLYRDSN
jgi:hypothetical protein